MYLVIAFLCQLDKINDLLIKMRSKGMTGGTLMDAVGMRHAMPRAFDVPLIASLDSIFNKTGELNKILLSVVETQGEANQLMDLIEEVFGDLHKPNTGMVITLKLENVRGFDRWLPEEK